MTALPNRISAFTPLTAEHETALAREFLEIQSEEELDHFLPLLLPAIKLAAPLLMKAAGPLLKSVAGSLFSGGSKKKSRPRDDQEQFLGKIVKGLFGGELESETEGEGEGESQEQFLGGIVKGLLGGELETEHEQFLGGIIGKLFGKRELEAENYVQEQFLGSILGKLMGGELQMETPDRRLGIARRFVRLASAASHRAALEIMNHLRSGRPPTELEARKIVLRSIVLAARRFTPHVAAVAFPVQAGAPEGTVLEMMIADAMPMAMAGDDQAAHGPPVNGTSHRAGMAKWVREGNRLIFNL